MSRSKRYARVNKDTRALPSKPDWFTCPCGKRGYLQRADASRARRGHRDRTHLGLYRCHHAPEPWHLGHRPERLTRGEMSRDEIPRKNTHYVHDMTAEHELADRFNREDHQ